MQEACIYLEEAFEELEIKEKVEWSERFLSQMFHIWLRESWYECYTHLDGKGYLVKALHPEKELIDTLQDYFNQFIFDMKTKEPKPG